MIDFGDISKAKQKKKLIPHGCCSIEQLPKQNYVINLLNTALFYKFIMPSKYNYSQFVIVEDNENGEKIYRLYSQINGNFLLSSRKQSHSIGCNYILSTHKNPMKDQGYVGKVRGNFFNNQFNVYDSGNNPDKGEKPYRNQLAFIKFNEKSVWKNQASQIKLIIPRPIQSNIHLKNTQSINTLLYEPISLVSLSSKENILETLVNTNSTEIQVIRSRLPIYNINKHQYQTNYQNLYQPSNMNLILYTSLGLECLIMNKRSKRTFHMSIGCPLTIIQGFGFFLSCIENKQS